MSAVRGMPAAAPVAADLQQVVLQPADITECVALAERSFEEFERGQAVLRAWFDARVLANPWQHRLPGIGVGLRSDGELVAFRAMFAQPWWLEGASAVAAFAAHTAVDPRRRGQGLGTALIDASRAFARISGSTSAGVVTQKSYARLGFAAIGGSDSGFHRARASFVGSLQRRFGGALGRVLGAPLDLLLVRRERSALATGRLRLEELTHCDDEVERLWLRARATERSCLERGSRYLNWRLFEQPTAPLRLAALRDAAGTLRALAVWTTKRYDAHVSSAVLRDLLWADEDGAALPAMLHALLAHWRALGHAWASLEVTSPRLARCWHELGYEAVPSNGNRYWIHAAPPLAPATLDAWFRSGLDGDYGDVGA